MTRCPVDNTEMSAVGGNLFFLHCTAGPHDYTILNNELSMITPQFVTSNEVAINTGLASVLIGTPVTPVAIAANSLIVGTPQASGDVVLAVNTGGNSHMAFHADGSTGDTLVQAATGLLWIRILQAQKKLIMQLVQLQY